MLNLAIQLAQRNPIRKLPQMGAIIVYRGQIIGEGWNQLKSHPLAARFGRNSGAIYLHAEVDAIKQALRWMAPSDRPLRDLNLNGCTMYIARVLKNGTPAMARPCEGCQRALATFGIEKVFWTTGE